MFGKKNDDNSSSEVNFQDRMYMGSAAVYAAIERGEIQGEQAVRDALEQARYDAS
ncbi:hypothetical protein OHB37_31375 [Streptomyces albidoflavus]|uniref:hypothetical protein n=1 Tax=Streptomyces albidoflavus TaxID=1886 RepID=UPI00308B867C|nr:hypothetical protein OHB37_31430 [Streptomyces albidoflavus]WSB18713.1 hypothetical protein OHB37_31375 [Streptomyces albidoflavus]